MTVDPRAAWSSAAEHHGRGGMVTVWDHRGGYVGCMGVERWEKLLAEDAAAVPAGNQAADGDTMSAWLRESARELDHAHALLDELGVGRKLTPESECECTLATRIAALASARGGRT